MYPVTIVVEDVDTGPTTTTAELSVTTKAFPTRRLSVPPRFVELPPVAVARIQDESRRLDALFQSATHPRQWHSPFEAPAHAPISGSFGARSVFNGQPRSPHSGLDFRSAAGTPVAAPAAGVVALANSLYFTGNTVVIDHGLGLYSLLAHLSKFAIKDGDRVQRGQIVGFVGATGRVTGPHLHWSVRLNGARVDPRSLIVLTNALPEGLE
jgi:murein DD-endopeptidase MepM/ murein hydrolase activator NlpD